MRIGIDVRLWNQTGVGRYIRNLVKNLEKIDKNNSYVLFARDEDKIKIKNTNFKIVIANVKWHTFAEQLTLVRIINRENLDLMHFPYHSVPIFYNRPFIVTIHDLIPFNFETGKASTLPSPVYKFKSLAYRFVVSKAARKSKKIIAPSGATKKDILNFLKIPNSKVDVVYEGIDRNIVNKKKLKRENLFLYVGNAYPHKNLDFLIGVFKDLPQDHKLILVGQKDYFYKILERRVKKLNLQNRVEFFGHATDEQLSQLYRRSRAFIIPSLAEGFGLPVLEAMANECLVLASDIPVFHEIAGSGAVYFNPHDADDLLNKIKRIEDFEYKKKVGVEQVKNFSWEKMAKETLRIYKQSLKI